MSVFSRVILVDAWNIIPASHFFNHRSLPPFFQPPVKQSKSRAARQEGQKEGTAGDSGVASADAASALEAYPHAAVRGLESAASTGMGALYCFTSDLRTSFGVGGQEEPLSNHRTEASPGGAVADPSTKEKRKGKGTKQRSETKGGASEIKGQEEGLLATANPLKGFALVCW